jgi:hypothetical protein
MLFPIFQFSTLIYGFVIYIYPFSWQILVLEKDLVVTHYFLKIHIVSPCILIIHILNLLDQGLQVYLILPLIDILLFIVHFKILKTTSVHCQLASIINKTNMI